MSIKKLGRPPIDTPKSVKLTVRVEEKTLAILDDYCQRKDISRADGVREAIDSLQKK